MKKDDWECEFGPYHIFDPEDISVCFCCSLIHFYCANCEKEIAVMTMDDCPKESRAVVHELVTALEEGNGREPA